MQRPKVLLLEAGSDNEDVSYRVPADRFKTFQEATINWGYKTVPQKHLKGQQIDYSRGKGLGGSTAINFSCCRFLGQKLLPIPTVLKFSPATLPSPETYSME